MVGGAEEALMPSLLSEMAKHGSCYLASTRCQLICLLTRRTSPAGRENFAGLKYQNHEAKSEHTVNKCSTWDTHARQLNDQLPQRVCNWTWINTAPCQRQTLTTALLTEQNCVLRELIIYLSLFILWSLASFGTPLKKTSSKWEGHQDDQGTGVFALQWIRCCGIVLI